MSKQKGQEKWEDIRAGDLLGAFQKLLTGLGDRAGHFIAEVNTNCGAVTQNIDNFLSDRIRNHDPATPSETDLMLGTHLIKPHELADVWKMNVRLADIARLGEPRFTIDTIRRCQHSHVLIPVPPDSAMHIRRMIQVFPIDTRSLSAEEIHEKCPVGWHLIRLDVVAKGFNHADMISRVPKGETEIASLPLIVYTVILLHMLRNIQIRSQGEDVARWGQDAPCQISGFPEAVSVPFVHLSWQNNRIEIGRTGSRDGGILEVGLMTECKPDF